MTLLTLSKRKSQSINKGAQDVTLPENRRETGATVVPGGEAHRWKSGQSGNPGGRPRMGALARACREVVEKPVPGDREGRTYAQAIAERLAELSLKGHMGAMRELADRGEGRAGQFLNIEIRPASPEPETTQLDVITVMPGEADITLETIESAPESEHA
jgi:Family of unknown function (DUF5681)